ncbi:MAG: tetratricopeptide repeat protein [Thermodesulfobacteriota bacterium]
MLAPGEVRGTISADGSQALTEKPLAAAPSGQPAPSAPAEAAKPAPGAVTGAISATPSGTPAAPAEPEAGSPAPAPAPVPAEQSAGISPPQPSEPAPGEQEKSPDASGDEAPKKEGDSLEDTTFAISGEQALARGEFEKALNVARTLLEKPGISKELREGALYLQAESLFNLNKDKLAETYVETNDALQQALNFNTASMRLPRALIKLGYLNLRQGNLPEARAYFNLLGKKFPLDEEVPLIDVYWGDYYLDQAKLKDADENHRRAAESFRQVLSKYPESRFARDAALGLSRAQLELRQYPEAEKIIDYIDKRWPRYYVENPVMRRVSADIAYKLGEYEKAKDDYLWFYNLVPGDASNDLVLSRLGDVNVKLGKRDAAREFYDMAIRLHPGKEGALMSMMRLAEQGIHDAPTMQEMFKTFADPKDIRPDKIYEIIVGEYPQSPLAPLALLKLAMWRLYKQEYPETLDLVNRFVKSYPGDELEKQAVEVGSQAYGKIIVGLLEQMDYKRILELWREYPYLASRADLLSDLERLGVALALYYQGAPREALALVEPFLDKGPGLDSQKALALMLTIYRENQDWQAVLDTLKKVSSWDMAPGPRRALEFAQALALEHTGQHARSRLLWARLAADNELSPDKRAYAVYYQARTAYERKDYDKALAWALDSRTLFKEASKDDGKARDALLLMIEANQAAGRYREALGLCAEYETEAPEKSAEWAANRLRMAKLNRLLGNTDEWRRILVDMRDSLGDSLYGKLAASELTTRNIEERAGRLTGPP